VGRAVSRRLAEDGYAIALVGRNVEPLEHVLAEVTAAGGRADALTCDVAVRDDVDAAVRRTEEALGPIGVLVNNAGIAESAPFTAMDDEMWHRTLAVNLTGPYYCMRAVLPGMLQRGHGRIINIASTAARQGYAYTAAYVASKHGLLGLTRAVAVELRGRGVTVNAVCPGWLDTEMTERSVERITSKTGRTAAEARAMLAAMNARGTLIDPAEVAALVARLASPAAGDITGQDFDIA
jgi:NAD(P)-dependent dehydrogenase (short-subunit alcohol dehydrogenase family)